MSRAVSGAVMIVGTSLCIQSAAALAHGLFADLGPAAVSSLRFALAAVVLLAAVRPALRGRDGRTWGAIVGYGASLAALNITFFQAIDEIPMGIAVTLAFVPPLVMALVTSRRRIDVGWAVLAGAGIAALGGFDPPGSLSGVVFGLAAGAAWVVVAYTGASVGRRTERVDGLALALPVAAVIALPLGVGELRGVDGRAFLIVLAIAVGGLIIPFALELEALRRLEPRIVAVVYSVDPAVAALVGLLILDQRLSATQVLALVAVMVASAGATASAARAERPRGRHVPEVIPTPATAGERP